MEAKELRIGNYYSPNEDENYTDVTAHDFSTLVLSGKFYGYPIPLTEEWLLKFGFDLNTVKQIKKKIDGSKSVDKSIHIKDGEFNFMNDSCSNAGCYYLTTIKYVHQLQNLYHALGEELTIK